MAISPKNLLPILNLETPLDPLMVSRLAEATQHEEDLALHARKAFTRSSAGTALLRHEAFATDLLGWDDKIKLYKSLLRFPLSTTAVCDRIADVITKVFRGQDGYAYALFEDGADETDFAAYLEEKKEAQFWRSAGFQAGFYAPHTLLVVDLPADRQPVRGLPAPYWYTISVSAIRAVDFDEKGDLTYVLVQFAPDRCGGIDAINYYLFERSTASNGQRVWTQTSQSPHGLGQVPARFLWNDADESQLVRQGILTALKSDLDWLLFWQTSKKQYDLGAAYEMTWLMQPECTFTPTNGKRCQSGIVEVYNETTDKFIPVKCPACKARKRLGGIGSVLELPIPISKDQPDLRPPAGRIPAEEVSLKYITAEQERLEQVLFRQATSQRPDVTAEAINEKQVGQQADNEEAVLQYFAEGLSDARTWLWQTVATLRYGPQRFQGAATSYGTRFTAIDRGAIAQQLTDGTALPVWAKGDLLDKLRTALANGNARHRNRLDLLAMLEPWQELSLDDARTMGLDQTDPPAFALKADFTRRLGWLEAEHGDIMLIMADATPITRFKFILNLLYGYGQTDFLGSVRTADRPGPVDNGSAPGTDQPPAAGNTRAAQYEPA